MKNKLESFFYKGHLKICDLSLAVLCPPDDTPQVSSSNPSDESSHSPHPSTAATDCLRSRIRPGRNYKAPEFLFPTAQSLAASSEGSECGGQDDDDDDEGVDRVPLKIDEIKGDIWSLGCVISEMKSGVTLFNVLICCGIGT